jgi:DNA processing protein
MHVPEMGLQRAKLLLQRIGVKSAEHLFKMRLPDLLRIDGIGKQVANNLLSFKDWDQIEKILERTDKIGAKLLSIDDEAYPEMLRHTYDPPIILWYKGDKNVFSNPGIAVIGTRRPGRYGLDQTEKWVKALVQNGICINSGLAYGVDAKAHQTAVDNGGKTIAVLGSGIDVIYPAKNTKLAAQIIEQGGAVVSEYVPGTPPDAGNFPGRNRVVSGMSHGTLVVESGIKGGSMITARYALDQNREVFVVPHQLDYLQGEGCNYLIRTGQGKLVQSLEDILEEISVETSKTETNHPKLKKWKNLDLNEEEEALCILLEQTESMHIDMISEQLSTPTFKLLPVILELELKGAIKQRAGKHFELN